ncbi:hypothetical protein SAY87_011514 [Trapa incisa]|uniref:Histone-lysine N-methyltransferase ASHR1 n=1 Tax=Trapa incisa TaxID=236973 RepID=A0AAN7GS19_9MYRT|nr:hypothetical protein SAY87_011514 [Trapa incisa]
MEDLTEALRQWDLRMSTLPEKGRSLFANKDFFPGEVIIKQEPCVFVPNNSASQARCDTCFSSSNLKKCSACRVVWYCGSSCQKSQWKVHQLECRALSRLDEDKRKYVTPSIRLMLKLCIHRKLQDERIIPSTATDNYRLVEALVSHMSDIDQKQLVLYAQMANLVNLILQWPNINIKEITENFSKLSCNGHTICDSEFRPLGTGLYPVISIINHSCLPNAVLVFEETAAVVRAVQYISSGSEVSISYIETAGSTITRQKALKEQYFFTCSCPRCENVGKFNDLHESAVLEGYRCRDDSCTGFLLRDSDNRGFFCQRCGLFRGKEELKELSNKIRNMLDRAVTSTSSAQLEEAISIYKMVEQFQRELYHPRSIFLLQTREQLLKMLMEVEDWKEALAYCRLTVPVYESVYPSNHPLLGLQYYTCGKLKWLLGYTDGAVRSLTKAVDTLRVTHGTSTPFIKELILKLEEARAETSYKLKLPSERVTVL